MDALTAIPTSHGLSVLNSSLKNTVTKYALIGATAHDAADDELGTFYTGTIENSFYDSNGVLTMQVELPVATDFGKYLYRIAILDATDQLVVSVATPKQALAAGIGGFMTIKIAVTGEAGEGVFKASDYVTGVELEQSFQQFKETVNGVEVGKSGGIYQFTRIGRITPGNYPQCLTSREPPTFFQLLEFAPSPPVGQWFEINVYKQHRGLGYSNTYYEYLNIKGVYQSDGVGAVVTKVGTASRLELYRSDEFANDFISISESNVTPLVIRQINAPGNATDKAMLMLRAQSSCGAEEHLGIDVRFSNLAYAKPPVTFSTQTQPVYPNFA